MKSQSMIVATMLCWASLAGAVDMPPDAILMQRLETRPKVSPWPNDWFQPRGLVAGAGAAKPFKPQTKASIKPDALAKALSFAKDHQIEALVVWRAGKFEMADVAPGFDSSQPFNSYHMHWLPLVLAVGAAVDEGKISSIDAPVSQYLKEWASDERGTITLRQLLTMSAGLDLYIDSVKPEILATHVFFGGNRESAILKWPRKTAAGTEFEYNYIVPELIGLILERATGQSYTEYLSKKIWKPLGNADATVWLDKPNGQAYHNAAMFASLGDWVNLAILLAQGGKFNGKQIISAKWMAEMTKASAVNPNFGFIWLGSPFNPERRFSKEINYNRRHGHQRARRSGAAQVLGRRCYSERHSKGLLKQV
jgi:CubicO group peptidase (beta-lactamase class C family)